MRISSEAVPVQLKQKGKKQNSPSVTSPQYDSFGNGGRFYGGEDDAFWRLSFSVECDEEKKGKNTPKSEVSSLDNGGRWNAKKQERREGTSKFKESDRGLKDERKSPNVMKISMEVDEYNREKEFENFRRRFERKSQRVLQERVLRLEREAEDASTISVQKDVLQFGSPRTIWTPRRHSFGQSVTHKNSSHRGTREDHAFNTQRFQKTERRNLFKAKTEKKRQSLHLSREIQRRKTRHSSKVRVYSPRMASKVEICKIQAIEVLRKAKQKMNKAKEKKEEEIEGLDSFAVVKCSLNPHQDFRNSMVEMITEKQISQPEEMEELLACYLTLNSDEYHDLIIKVFRQVWFDMSSESMGVKLDK